MDIGDSLLGRSKYLWADDPEQHWIVISNRAFGSKDYDYDGKFYLTKQNKDLGRTGTHVLYVFCVFYGK